MWGYGHYIVFASAAAIGAGIEVAVEQAVGVAHIATAAASAAVTVPSAVYLFTVWLLHTRFDKRGLWHQSVLPAASVAVLVCTLAGHAAVLLAGVVGVIAVAVSVAFRARIVRAGLAGARENA